MQLGSVVLVGGNNNGLASIQGVRRSCPKLYRCVGRAILKLQTTVGYSWSSPGRQVLSELIVWADHSDLGAPGYTGFSNTSGRQTAARRNPTCNTHPDPKDQAQRIRSLPGYCIGLRAVPARKERRTGRACALVKDECGGHTFAGHEHCGGDNRGGWNAKRGLPAEIAG